MKISLSPSAAERWLHCTASPIFIAELEAEGKLPPQSQSKYADEGTRAHSLAADMLNGLDDGVYEDAEMARHCKAYAKFCEDKLVAAHGECKNVIYGVEKRYPLWYQPDRNSYIDFFVANDKRINIVDFKYGEGIKVEAKQNPQLAIYAWNVITSHRRPCWHEGTLVSLTIYQPRAKGHDPRFKHPVSLWSVSLGELEEFCRDIHRTTAHILYRPDNNEGLTFAPSEDVCRWCPAEAVCRARAELYFGELPEILEPMVEEVVDFRKTEEFLLGEEVVYDPKRMVLHVHELDPVIRANLVRHRRQIVSWLEELETYCRFQLEAGHKVPGLKLVPGHPGHRKWIDEDQADKFLAKFLSEDERRPRSFISPAQVEKMLADKGHFDPKVEKKLTALVMRPASASVMVPDTDPREDLSAPIDFENLDEGMDLLS